MLYTDLTPTTPLKQMLKLWDLLEDLYTPLPQERERKYPKLAIIFEARNSWHEEFFEVMDAQYNDSLFGITRVKQYIEPTNEQPNVEDGWVYEFWVYEGDHAPKDIQHAMKLLPNRQHKKLKIQK